MAVERNWVSIPATQLLPQAPVQAEDAEGRRLLANLNALDEALADRAAPGAASQQYFGHDHAYEGGAPIIRGMAWCADGGHEAIAVLDPIGFDRQGLGVGLINASPGLNRDGTGQYRVEIRYAATKTQWRVRFNGGADILLEAMEDGADPEWATLYGPIPSDDWLASSGLEAWPIGDANDLEEAELQLYTIVVMETYQDSQPRLGLFDAEPVATSQTIYSHANDTLDSVLVANSESLDAYTYAAAMMRANAIFEHTTDRAAPGAASQRIQGHDHHASGYGGRPVPMGCIYSVRTYRTANPLWTVTTTASATWYYFDQAAAAGTRRTTTASTPGGTVTTDPMFLAKVTHGFSSSGSPPSTAPYLMGIIYLRHPATPSAVVDVRVYNLTTGNHSAVATGNSVSEETIIIPQIPCTGGITNRFALEVKSNLAGLLVDMMGFCLFEVGEYGGTNRTYVSSTGTAALAVANGRL